MSFFKLIVIAKPNAVILNAVKNLQHIITVSGCSFPLLAAVLNVSFSSPADPFNLNMTKLNAVILSIMTNLQHISSDSLSHSHQYFLSYLSTTSSFKNLHFGFSISINSFFLFLVQPLISFSLSIAYSIY